ncbi:MAG TPA: glycoside hydrolase family 2 TIM barrel-domain containing protein [Phycisphaerae bacterium]|nr:glycoside hydrolase family 2 TIM barrel-domain containing protein [Phycisphaerae bacterium]
MMVKPGSGWGWRAMAMVAAVAAAVSTVRAAEEPRQVQSFDKDWRFLKGDATGAEAPAFADSSWERVDVPQDWAILGPFTADAPTGGAGGFAPSGVSWYRKSFSLPAGAEGKHVFIDFDGVMANSDVWVNGFHLGKRPYGYSSFQYELTGHLNPAGQANVIAVRTDTSAQRASRYYEGAGIYRHVRLEIEDAVHIDHWGAVVTTPKVTADAATVHVTTKVVNQSDAPREVALDVTLVGPDGKPAGTARSAPQTVAAGQSVMLAGDVTLSKPEIWDIDHPAMYQAVATIDAGGGAGKAIDDESVPFGVRSFDFSSETGFSLNGKNFKLIGVCLHADAEGLGIAVPEDEWIYRLQTLKTLGVNAVRTAHNPPSPEFLDACDKVGMLVMDETFDCWTVGKNTYDYHIFFKEWNLIDARDMVMRDRNHPSIVLYSSGNEIHDTPNAELAKSILKPLVETIHEADPTRPVTQALFRPNSDGEGGAYKNGLSDMLDVVGTNYRDDELLAAHAAKPTIKIVGTENKKDAASWAKVRDNPAYSGHFIWSGVDYLGETFAFPNIGAGSGIVYDTDQIKPEGYQDASWWLDQPVVYMARTVTGGFGRGGRGGAGGAGGGRGGRQGGPGAPNDDGLDGQPPPPGANAGGDGPTLAMRLADGTMYIAAPGGGAPGGGAPAGGNGAGPRGGRGGRGGAAGGAFAGRGGPTTFMDWDSTNSAPHQETVQVYSNCDEVELLLNGQSLGSKPRGTPDSVRAWTVDYAPGTLKAIGKNKGQAVATYDLTTPGKPAKLVVTASTQKLFNDFDSVAHVTVTVTDDKGVTIPNAANQIKFTLSGPGKVEALENAHLVAQDFRGDTHDAYNGQCVGFIAATGDSGKITLTVSSPGLADGTISFQSAPGRPLH